jgi:hypothetical protein
MILKINFFLPSFLKILRSALSQTTQKNPSFPNNDPIKKCVLQLKNLNI